MTRSAQPAYTLVFDGNCRMCSRFAAALRRRDRHGIIEIVPSQAPGVQARFPWIPAAAFSEAIQLVDGTGRTWQGADALEQIIGVLPRVRWIAWMFRVPLIRPIADWIYRWVARNRYRFGCSDHCQLSSTDRSPTAARATAKDRTQSTAARD